MDEALQIGLGLHYVAEVDRAVQNGGRAAHTFSEDARRSPRRSCLKLFPYSVFFLPEASRIVVLGIDVRRDPLVLQARV